MNADGWMAVRDVADALGGVSTQRVYQLVKKGKLRSRQGERALEVNATDVRLRAEAKLEGREYDPPENEQL